MPTEIANVPVYCWIIVAILLLTQGTFLFRDAQKRGLHPWFWGIWGLTTVPMPFVLYFIIERKIYKKLLKKK